MPTKYNSKTTAAAVAKWKMLSKSVTLLMLGIDENTDS